MPAHDIDDLTERTWIAIREIQERYQRELEPHLHILRTIQAMRPPAPIFIDYSKLSDAEKAVWDERIKPMEKGL